MTESPFGEEKPGLLTRLFKRAGTTKHVVRRGERLDMTVPAARADGVRLAVERWLAGYGVTAPVTTQDAGNGKTRLHADLEDADAAKLNLGSQAVQKELEDLLTAAVSDSPR
jgi:hypothetical protein